MAICNQVSLEQQEQVLENNRDFIVKRLDADDVIDELIQTNLIGQNAAQRIQLVRTSRIEKNRIIFDQLITCGPVALEKFCEILRRKKRQSFIAEQLEKCILSTTIFEPSSAIKSSSLDVSRLKARYVKLLPTGKTDWPKHKVTQYVKLAIVKKEDVTLRDKHLNELTRLTLQGDVDKILKKKEPLNDLKDIFHYNNEPCPRLILIMGGPGIGKTTLAYELCLKWARDGFLAEDFDAVILIPMMTIQQNSLEKALMKYTGEENYHQLKKTAGNRCLIILEGLDELAVNRQQTDPFLLCLIKECTVLEEAVILITSRPQACKEINADRKIEVVGFGNDEIREFIERSEIQPVEELLKQLDEYPQLHSLCYIPMNLVMLVDIFQCSEKKLPSTLTELYQLFIVMTLKRQVMKKNVTKKPAVCSSEAIRVADNVEETLCVMLRGIPKETIGIVFCLSRLAYRGFFDWYCHGEGRDGYGFKLKEPRITFTETDLTQCDIEVTSDFDGFGLLKATPTHELLTDINTYSFNHLTIQEYLCAVYISLQSQQERLHLLRKHFDEYPNVFTFVCGLTGLASSKMFQFIYSKLILLRAGSDVIAAMRCINESEQSSGPHHLVSPFTLKMSYTLFPYDCVCISSILSCYPVSQLKMVDCNIDNRGAELLVKHYPNKNLTGQLLEELNLSYNNLTSEGMEHVMKIVRTSSASLKALNVSGNDIGDDGMAVISEALQHNKSLATLEIAECEVSVKGVVPISQLLNITHTLQELDMSDNDISDDGMAVISEALQHNKSLTVLKVAQCGLSVKGAISISKMMTANCLLQQLVMDDNDIGDDGTSAIAEAVGNCKISKLEVDNCGITLAGAKSLAAALSSNYTIRVLGLLNNAITTEGALLVVKAAIDNTVCQIYHDYENDEIMTNTIQNMRRQLQEAQSLQLQESNLNEDYCDFEDMATSTEKLLCHNPQIITEGKLSNEDLLHELPIITGDGATISLHG